MQWFIVEASNRPGELARHTEAIAKRNVNLSSLVCLGIGDRGGAAFCSTDEAGLRAALDDAGIAYREISSVTAKLEDTPGTAAEAARALADAGVNVELVAPVGMSDRHVNVAFGVDNIEAARMALGDRITEWTAPQMAGSR